MLKRGYLVEDPDEEYSYPIVAGSSREAKKIAWNECDIGCEWIDLRVQWRKKANVSDLPFGYVGDYVLALRRGLYDWLEERICEICGTETVVYSYKGKAMCSDCIENDEDYEKEIAELEKLYQMSDLK